ncbi:hypothetical protein AAE02nite_43120 [Adhaeribacter aerolatus]|uniref:STAS/SEC14 domain-containing protein n=1 Tax=Adhaeribacter aerolatus TaxID=670289 RepID=A0A512B3W2_9BACT|nr:hypothetical protein [Adhaeribacter aerolatus]GEO06648.1 hypothetical protein AAE02nite_43120 [Adhaeribacter aerolatus]
MIPLELTCQNEFVRVETNFDYNYVKITWLQPPSSEIYKRESLAFTHFAIKNNLNNILIDVRERSSLKTIDQDWLVYELFPLFKNRSIRFAYLISIDDFNIMDTYKIHDYILTNPEYNKHVAGMIFLDEAEAQNWLLEIGLYL